MKSTYVLIAAVAVCVVTSNLGCTNSTGESNNDTAESNSDVEKSVVANQSKKPSATSARPAPKAKPRKAAQTPKPQKTETVAHRPDQRRGA